MKGVGETVARRWVVEERRAAVVAFRGVERGGISRVGIEVSVWWWWWWRIGEDWLVLEVRCFHVLGRRVVFGLAL